jgi:Predicted hydrolases of the HAD superfamily
MRTENAIRLIGSDRDGTLLQYGKKELEDEIREQIRELHRPGNQPGPASGRQYTSPRKAHCTGGQTDARFQERTTA